MLKAVTHPQGLKIFQLHHLVCDLFSHKPCSWRWEKPARKCPWSAEPQHKAGMFHRHHFPGWEGLETLAPQSPFMAVLPLPEAPLEQ